MVNPAFSESQLKNLRRQNRHLASTHRRKLVFLQASRNPAHGSGRPFFVRDVPVPASFCPAFAPPAPVSAAPQLRPFRRPHRSVPSSPSRSRTPDKVRVCTVRAAVPHHRPALRERSRPGIFLSGPCRFALRPSGSRFRSSAVFALSRRGSAPPRGDRQNRLLLRPGTRKGLSDRSQTAPFYPYCYSGTFPNTQFSENWKNSSDGPLHSYSRSRTSPPPNMLLKGSKNLPDSSVRSRIAQPADRLPAPAAAGLSSSSHRSSGSPDR